MWTVISILLLVASATAAQADRSIGDRTLSAPGELFDGRQHDVGTEPRSVVAGDLNNDGNVDLVVANYKSNDVSVLLNRKIQGLSNEHRFEVGTGPVSVQLGDMNSDGFLDAAVANSTAGTISVMLNDGLGAFPLRLDFPSGGSPRSVAVGDVTGDYSPDIVVGCAAGDRLLRNQGGAMFASPAALSTQSNMVRLIDFDGDGDFDIAGGQSELTMLYNNGVGVFSAVNTGAGSGRSFAFGDIDGDSDLDVIGLRSDLRISIGKNQGNGTFTNAPSFSPAGSFAEGFALGDLDGDHDLDLAIATRLPEWSTLLYRNNGAGVFTSWGAADTGDSVSTVLVTDLNTDGHMDVVAANSVSNELSIAMGSPSGGLVAPLRRSTSENPSKLETADFDGDGDIDVVVLPSNLSRFSVHLNGGGGVLGPGIEYVCPPDPIALAAGDMDQDGDPDIVMTHFQTTGGGRIGVWLNDGIGSLGPPVDYVLTVRTTHVTLGDVNGDTHLDAVVTAGDIITVLLNSGTGALGAPTTYPIGESLGGIAIGDITGDGCPDIVHGLPSSGRIGVLINNCDGTFSTAPAIEAGRIPTSVALEDLDGDNRLDILVRHSGVWNPDLQEYLEDGVSVFVNRGDATFAPPAFYEAGENCIKMVTGDVDSDGDSDVIVANYTSANASILLNDDSGVLGERRNYVCGGRPIDLCCADVDGDSMLDLIIANTNVHTISTLVHRGRPPTFCPADVDGDGYANAADFSILAVHFGESVAPGTHGDLNADAVVDIRDFMVFAAGFGCGP